MQILNRTNDERQTTRRPATLIECLRRRAVNQPGRTAYTFLIDGEDEGARLTYGELDAKARAIGAWLQSCGAAGERVLLLYPPDLDYVAAFFGCLYAGAVAVPAYPPRQNRSLDRLQSVAADARAAFALTTSAIRSKVEALAATVPGLRSLRWQATEEIGRGFADEWREPGADADTLAFLQYTSGSTSAPKGVAVTHGNLMHNERVIREAFGQTEDSVVVGWLPLYHDMGLIGNVLQPLYVGAHCVLMSPVTFLQSPSRWLRAISRYRATTSGGPNFAYDLCVRKTSDEQRAALDLSSWRVAFNGAEPVRAETLDKFAAAFEPCGFRRDAFHPCYGLAEATLFVSGKRHTTPPVVRSFDDDALERHRAVVAPAGHETPRRLVSCGEGAVDQQIVVADHETLTRCAPGEVGEIWVAGPSVAAGYWGREEQTRETFGAHLADTGDGPFLRTGDLGFVHDGELFVTGRLKDLIIIRGLNHYPQDIERTVEACHPALRAGGGAAFSVEAGGEERLVVVQEVARGGGARLDEAVEAIRRGVSEEHEVQVYAVLLVKAGSIPKTSSGKIQRRLCRTRFLNGELDAAAHWRESAAADGAPTRAGDAREVAESAEISGSVEALADWLRAEVAATLRVEAAAIDVERPVTHYGLDSLTAVELAHKVEAALGVSLPVAGMLEGRSLSALAESLKHAARARGESSPRATLTAAGPGGGVAAYPLSHNQQSLWFHQQLAPESVAYNLTFAARVESELEADRLRRAVAELVRRHASLRTTFGAADGDPVQQVHERADGCFEEHDASGWGEEDLRGRLAEAANRPFDLRRGPLFRISLFHRPAGGPVLLVAAHHIIVDFWSLSVLLHELGALYAAEAGGARAEFAPPRLQYGDYVRWQREMLAGEEGERQWSFWERQLGGELPVLALPTDRPRPPAQTYRGAALNFRLGADLARRLKELSARHGATLFMTLLAAYDLLLYRHTGQEEIVVGSPASGRLRPALAGVVGYLVNPVAIRVGLSGGQTFDSLLDEVRRRVASAFEHQEYPLSLLVKRLQPEREAERSPLFQTMFVMQRPHLSDQQGLASLALNEDGTRVEAGGLLLESLSLELRRAQFDITLTMAEVGDELGCAFEYNTDLFDATTISRMAGHLRTLLETIAADPGRRLAEFPLLTAEEERQLLIEWNETRADYPTGECIHQLFEAQAARTPDAVALVYGDGRLSYAELNRGANRVAHSLLSRGVGPEVRVGILMERSPKMVTALLGVLKAGGAYVPLDPEYPQDRLTFMLEDTRAKVLLTERHLAEALGENGFDTICLDAEPDAGEDGADNPRTRVVPGNLAYVIYTSGSTGQPKGAMNTHRAVVNRLLWMQEQYRLTARDRVLQKTPFGFDVSVWEFFWPLITGARLVVARPAGHRDAAYLARLIEREAVTTLHFVPSMLQLFLDEADLAGCASLRRVVCSGEALSVELQERFFARVGGAELHNLYGPTEAAVDVTYWACERGGGRRSVPIGRPVANTHIYILDGRLRPVPVGVTGELYIGGVQVARGYLSRPALTAEKFIPDPFSAEPGARLYKTGDLARFLEGGEIEFLGRADHQVKVRGFRIELGEIEAVLAQHPDVREAVVVAREDHAGHKRLVAYVVARSGVAPTVSELRRHVREQLPESMTPAVFMLLDELPLTPNGKVDRRALPEPESDRPELEQVFVAPRTPHEEVLARVWSELLGIERVGVHDNFFALGGDSILSIQVAARAARAGLHLTARELFQHQTIAGLVAAAGGARAVDAEQGIVTGEVPLTPAQHWFFEQAFVEPQHWNQSVLLTLGDAPDVAALEEAARQLLTRHDALRLRFENSREGWRQFNAGAETGGAFSHVDLSHLAPGERRGAIETAAADVQASLDLAHGPLARFVLFTPDDDGRARLLIVVHHLAVDGVSWRILLEDLRTAYEQSRHGDGAAMRLPKGTSYKRWAERLREYAQSEEVRGELPYWTDERWRRVAGLPGGEIGGQNTEASARSVFVRFDAEATRALLREVPQAYHAEINDVLLTAAAEAFGRWTGGGRVLLDVEGHGREDVFEGVDVTRTVGWFTTFYPVLLEPGAGDAARRVRHVREQLRAVPRRGLGYGLLRYLGGEEVAVRLRELPQAQVVFNYLGQFDQLLEDDAWFGLAPESPGAPRSPRAARKYLLEINGGVTGGELQFEFRYGANLHGAETIERLAADFVESLRGLIGQRRSAAAFALTPSDVPLARLDQTTLERVTEAAGEVEDLYPLSPTQEGMLFHKLLTPESGQYVEQVVCALEGEFDADAFGRAWRRVLDRHTSLRSAFHWEHLDRPLQVVRRGAQLPFDVQDWRGVKPEEQRRRLEDYLSADRRRGFDLDKAPLMRVALFREDERRHRLVLSYHHILLDGWSLPRVFDEVLALYGGERRGAAVELPPARPYRDYIGWLQRRRGGEAEAYWREYLRGFSAPTSLASACGDWREETEEGYAAEHLRLSAEATAALRGMARGHRLTLNTLLQGAWSVLLHRYTGEDDLLFGAIVSGRPAELPGVEEMVGLFINTLPVRVRVSPEASAGELLERMQEQQAESRQHEHSPLVEVQGWSEVPRGVSLFESILVFENYPLGDEAEAEGERAGLRLRELQVAEQSNYPLTVSIRLGRELALKISYERKKFAAGTVRRMLGHLETLLANIAADPARRAATIPMLTPAEERRALVEWNDTAADYPRGRCLHEIFEEQSERTPDAVALAFGGERLSYRELNRRANRLAHRLRAGGVVPESLVGICAERSARMVVGLLGIWKAGGAYLPLDPEHPAERLAFMIEDARPLVMLTERHLADRLPDGASRVEYLECERDPVTAGDESNPPHVARPEDLAYVIYTSGSTGRPKGVLVEHRQLANTMYGGQAIYRFTAEDVVPCVAPFAFDISLFELLSPLMVGGCSLLLTNRELLDERVAAEVLERVTVLHSAPGLMWQMVGAARERRAPGGYAKLREAFVGGDAISPELLAAMEEAFPAARVSVGYGPTETAIMCAHYPVPRGRRIRHQMIGAPMGNVRMRLNDRHGNLVPVGVVGEIYIGGAGVARGYLRREQLTAEKYVLVGGERWYRSGDLARYLADGKIAFVGRNDDQVKVRGYRIETGEVENALAEHEAVKACAVAARADAPGSKVLAAYVVYEAGRAATADALREHLRQRLPDYMIPSAFVTLDELPLTPLGKVDRRALPAPEDARGPAARAYVEPRTEVEKVLAGIWAEVLKRGRVGAEDDFFESGGHSLLATQVVARVRAAFGVEMPLRTLFEHPTVARLAERVEELESGKGREADAPPIVPVPRDGGLPLSFAQQRLWFLDQLDPGGHVYNVPHALRLEGRFDRRAMEATLSELVRRHEVLRTTFSVAEGRPVQVVNPAEPLRVEEIDFSHVAEGDWEAEVLRFASEEVKRPFDLASGPLLRFTLLRLAAETHVLLFTLHHIVSDGWSIGVLVREVAALYAAFVAGRPSPLEELPIQYADFAVWQRERLQGETLERHLDYWRRQLAGAPALLELPTDRPRPAVQGNRGSSRSFKVPAGLIRALEELSRREGVTLFMTTLAAWQTLLARYSGQEDISVGTSIANRNRAETEALIGFFANLLVMRTDLAGDPRFSDLLKRVRETALGAYAHQDAPFEKLVEELQAGRSLSHSPLFQVLFVLENVPLGMPRLPGLKLGLMEQETETTKYDLSLNLAEFEGEVVGTLEYDTDLFDATTAARIITHYLTLLESVVADPHERLSKLPLLTAEERERLLVHWGRAPKEYPRDACVHELFEQQAARTPDRVALVLDAQELTYGELNVRANQLAHHLRALGVGPEVLVGLCVERSVEMVVGLLGILKAGGAYLPLDPEYPLERLSFMLEDTRAPVLLTQEKLLDALPAHWGQVVCLDTEWRSIESYGTENPPPVTGAGNLAYVMYTSGSTGQPKGVSVVHRGVVRLVTETDYARFGAEEVFLQLAPVSFDASTFEIWGSLLHGARLALMGPQTPTLEELGAALARHRVTTLWLTAGLFHLMVDQQIEPLCGVRQLLAGGDVLNPAHVRRALERIGDGRVINGYGPTESTTFACCYPMDRATRLGATVPVGHAIANTEVYVLDRHLEPVPVGVPGELYLGGDGLARHYHRRPDLTAEKFIPSPFGGGTGARLYRTGDLVRWLPAGEIEFLGRLDEQVKIRGFRIESGEVEAALAGHGSIASAVVVAREEAGGAGKRLVAYVVGEDGRPSSAGELRAYLRQRLPDYMIPSAFVTLDELPLTPNGKVDRRALPEPEQTGRDSAAAYVAPRTLTEEMLAAIWTEVLGVERVGAEDNFFELGGHSLLATQVISRIREGFRVELPLRTVFESPTVTSLARGIDEAVRARQGVEAPPLTAHTRGDEPPPLSYAQQRLWFLDQLEQGAGATYNVQAAARLTGHLDAVVMGRALNEVVRRHEVLRTTFRVVVGQPRQFILPPQELDLDVIDLSGRGAEEAQTEVRRLAAEAARQPFDLASGPLLRICLYKLGESEHVIVLTMHHIISDGWSLGVLIREVMALYDAFLAGGPSPLEELPIQYADYAVWQRDWLQGEVLERQLAYWRERLAGAPSVIELPTDRPRPPAQSHRGETFSVALPAELTEQLKALSRREGVTLFMTLLAGFQLLLARYSGRDDIVVGTPIANRTRAEVEGLIGFFVNTLVLRTDLSGGPGFRELLGRVREVTLGAYAHQEVPFERLVEELSPERSLSHAPLFQVMFALQNAPLNAPALSHLNLKPLETENHAARFDLSLAVEETEDGLVGVWNYSTELYERATVERLAAHLARLLAAAAADPDRPAARLPLLCPRERRLLLDSFNDTRRPYPEDGLCLHTLFERQAARTPGRVAVEAGGRRLSYGELDERACRLAARLRAEGVGPEVLVGVLAERSVELVVGLLGVLKAGGAYVPLDPEYPAERLRFMLADAAAPVLLTQARLRGLAGACAARLLVLDEAGGLADAEQREAEQREGEHREGEVGGGGEPAGGRAGASPPPARASADNLCYVIYTSGSTGQPKGAMNTHRAVVNRLLWMQEQYRLTARDRVLQKTPFGFDVSVWEFFWPLLTGARLVLAEPGGHRDPRYLAGVARARRVSVLHFVPSMLGPFLDEPGAGRCRSLRLVVCSGEALGAGLRDRFFARAGAWGAQLHNLYGPTEAAVDVTHWRCAAGAGAGVPIGRPIANARLYVLDGWMEPVPVGVAGELYIGGVSPGRGYLGRAGLTAGRWVPDPFTAGGGGRLYRTGDVGRYGEGGEIEYLGRVDSQVKVRGLRIEPGEIEAALRACPGVREAAAGVCGEGAGRRLVGYVVGEGGRAPEAGELRSYLRQRLPDYMVPAAFVALDELPLTANGKLDRRALPEPERQRINSEFTPPHTDAERALARVWAEVLGIERVGAEDNFFELGGDSILSIQVVTRAARAGLHLTARQLFEHQTLAALAGAAQEAAGIGQAEAEQGGVSGAVELTPIQRRFFEQRLDEPHHYNQSVLLEVRAGFDPRALERAVRALVAHHDALRLRFARGDDGGWLQRNAAAEAGDVVWRRSLAGVGREGRARLIEREAERAQRSLRLGAGPLVRAVLFEGSAGEAGRLLVVAHHLVVDGVSWRVLVEDLGRGYEAAARGGEVELGPKMTSYRQWAARLRQFARSDEVAAQAGYWQREAGREVSPLPLDVAEGVNPAEVNTVGTARSVEAGLSAEETRALLTQVPAWSRARIGEVLLAGLARAYARCGGGVGRLLVEVEGHGREEGAVGEACGAVLDVSRTVGWFTSVFPVVLELQPGDDEVAALRRVKEHLHAVPGKGLGYGLLRYMGRDRAVREELSRRGRAEVLFNYHGQLDQVLSGASLFSQAGESVGASRGEQEKREYLLEINGSVNGGRLRVGWTYSEALHRRETIERLAAEFVRALQSLIAHCRAGKAGALIPSDFPLARISRAKLDELVEADAGVEDVYALSATQRGILFHSLYEPDSEVYFDQVSCTLNGQVNVAAFARAWRHLLDRHAVLRTEFAWQDTDEPVQVVRRRVPLPLEEEDWRGVSADEQQRRMATLLEAERRRGFDLRRAPLMRMKLVRLSEESRQLVWSWHHLLLDGWSVSLMLREVLDLYEAFSRGSELSLPRAPLYRDYIVWLQRQDMAQAEAYWRAALRGFSSPTALGQTGAPGGNGGSPEHESGYAQHKMTLPEDVTAALQSFARRHQLTLSTLTQGAWALLLSHLSGASDVVFGVTVSGRPAELPGVEEMVGLFINTLPLRVRVVPEAEAVRWLKEVQERSVELRQYEYSPLVDVQGWSELGRGLPLFESLVAFENYPADRLIQERAGDFRIDNPHTLDWNNFPLSVVVTPGAGLSVAFNYRRDRFGAAAVARLAEQLAALLRRMSEQPAASLKELQELLAEAGRQQQARQEADYMTSLRQKLKTVRRRAPAAEL